VNLNKKAQAFAYYELGEYQKAIEEFDKLTNTDNKALETITFYKANAYLSINNYKKAKDLFQQIVNNNNKEWKSESLWYLALISINLDKTDKAKQYLNELQARKSFKLNEVEDLINTIN
jgi:tetratricopeptide (TPR) repeat protein